MRASRALILCCLALAAVAGEKERLLFRPGPAESYGARDSHEGLVVAAEPFETREKTKPAFGKLDLGKAGILPVLVVMENKTDKTVRLDNLMVRLITEDRQKIEPTPAATVELRLRGRGGPPRNPVPSPIPLPRSSRARNLELQVHEFNMRLLPAKASASGFFYFDVGRGRERRPGYKLYLTELLWAHSGQALMFFEISLNDAR